MTAPVSVGVKEEHKKEALPCGVVTKTSGSILTSKKTRNYGYYDDTYIIISLLSLLQK